MSREQVEFIIDDLSRFSEREIVALALNVDANLRANPPLGTPVDTGWAAANWIPSVGEPSILLSDQRDPTPAEIQARRRAGELGLNEVLSWRLPDGAIFVTNSVPYITYLNEGHSPQSPAGFVQNALEVAVRETEVSASRRRPS